jgi:hypothetical protein
MNQNGQQQRTMTKLLMIIGMLTVSSMHTIAQQETRAKEYLQQNKFYAPSKQDMEEAVALMAQQDFQALAHMVLEGKISVPTKARREVFVTGTGGHLSGLVEFRFEGKPKNYWTCQEWIESP